MIKFILDSIFFGFGLWSLLFIFLSKKDKPLGSFSLQELDRSASFLLFFAGITYFVLLPLIYGGSINIHLGETGYGYSMSWDFFGQLIYLISSIILLYKPVRDNRIFRFFIGILFLLPIELLLIALTSFHQEFLPPVVPITFEMFIFPPLKGILFSILLLILHWSRSKKS
ncbi:MAG: hypothetical protein AAGD28_10430 [Bacteroidota bacterium]